MKSPLAIDKQTVKEFGITNDIEIPARKKLAFLQAQLQELQGAMWRARVDIIHAVRLQESDIEALKMKGNNNLVEHRNQVKQFTGGISMVKKLIEEIRADNPDLGEVVPTEDELY
jgi:hypothetical protein